MKSRKFIFVIAIAVLSALCLMACKDSGESAPPAEEEAAYEENNEVASEEASEEVTEEEPVDTRELKGIIFITRDCSVKEGYAGGAYHPDYAENAPIQIGALNPETGEYHIVRSFPYPETYRGSDPYICAMQYNNFDENYERMSLTIELEDGSSHVGWIDENGVFTDVTEQITTPGGDFSGLTEQYLGKFGPDNCYYFHDDDGWHRVPLDNLTQGAVEDVQKELGLWPDGSIGCSRSFYPDSSLSSEFLLKQAKDYKVQQWVSWIDQEQLVYTKMIEEYPTKYTILLASAGSDSRTEIVPDIKDRWNYNPVVSPDGSQVAFLSSLRSATDNNGYVFITGLDGDEPEKVDTDLSFYCFEDLEGSWHLMEWR